MYMSLKGFKLNLWVLIPLICSVIGLILIYTAVINLEPKKVKISDITHETIGRIVSTSGKIVYKKTHSAGHIFLTISDGETKIQVPLFSGFLNSLEEADLNKEDLRVGSEIFVSGSRSVADSAKEGK
jgi:aspartyl/asparaginyl-tRNA synthetase